MSVKGNPVEIILAATQSWGQAKAKAKKQIPFEDDKQEMQEQGSGR
jgi:hypothetical protein